MNTTPEYVIGVIHDHENWYYVGEVDHNGKELLEKEKYSPFLFKAKRYASKETLQADLEKINRTLTRKVLEVRHCPKCSNEFTGYPAISRDDNKTEICSSCGIREAVDSFNEFMMH